MSVTEKLANELEEQSKQLDELRENVRQTVHFIVIFNFDSISAP